MKNAMRKVLACVVVLTIALSTLGCALAADYPSKAFKLPAVQSRPAATPTEAAAPAEEPAVEEAGEPAADPVEEPAEAPVEEPEPEEEPQESIVGSAVVVLQNPDGSLNVRAGADKGSDCVAYLKHGDVVSVYGTSGGWTHVLTANGVEGYVASSYLQDKLPEEPAVEETEEPTVEETEEPAIEETEEPAVEETEEPAVEETEEPAVEETEEPAAEPTEEPAVDATVEPEAVELKYSFERDENGALVLDENGDPIAIVPEGMEIPVTYLRDEEGNLILDENGDPIVKDTVPADAQVILTLKDKLNPDRYIDVYATAENGLYFGREATMVAVLYGYDNAIYTLQWQNSKDGENWTDIPGATESRWTVVVTEENYLDYWQIQVTITGVQEDAPEVA